MNQRLKGSYLVSSSTNAVSGSSLKPSLTNSKFGGAFTSDPKQVFEASSSSSKGLITKLFSWLFTRLLLDCSLFILFIMSKFNEYNSAKTISETEES